LFQQLHYDNTSRFVFCIVVVKSKKDLFTRE